MTENNKNKRTSHSRRKNPDGQMPLRAHLKELRNRLIKAGLAIGVCTGVGFYFYKPTYQALTDPLTSLGSDQQPAEVVFSTVAQPFDIMLQVALFIGLILSSPIWLYQIWAYIMPGLKKKEKGYTLAFIGVAVPLFVGGILLGWFALPQALTFFVSLSPEGTANFIQATTYLPFVIRLLLAFGIALILPVVMVGLNLMGILTSKQILKHWRITVFLIAVVAAMGAPGSDVMTMFYLGAPLVVLFGIALLLCMIVDRRRAKKKKKQEEDLEANIDQASPLDDVS